jgi:hypothetical protein
MRPEASALNVLSTTRARAKMREFRVAPEDFNALPRDPAILFALAVGILGDVAATVADQIGGDAGAAPLPTPSGWDEMDADPRDALRFTSVFFDAYLNADLDDELTTKCILSGMTNARGWSRQEREGVRAPVDNAGRRQFALAQENDLHDERLWMGITKATGALGSTSCLVGTAEQVADSLLSYYRLGVSSFLKRGFDPVSDTIEFGRELIQHLKAAALEIDQRQLADAS